MTGPNPPDESQYPQNVPGQGDWAQSGYPGYPGYPPQPPQRPVQTLGMLWSSMVRNLGDRALRRARPRLGVALAGAGVGLALVGVLVWSGTYLIEGIAHSFASGGGGDDSRRLLGVFLSLAVAVLGYVSAIRRRSGPLSAAGVAASALGVQMTLTFLTFSVSTAPVSLDAIALVSIIAWLISYTLVPGTRGMSSTSARQRPCSTATSWTRSSRAGSPGYSCRTSHRSSVPVSGTRRARTRQP
ncbi:MAG: hypothetical protein ACRDQ1_10545 [Sciscionella sp.]